MDPEKAFCHNPECPARGQCGQGNIGVHSRKERRFICHTCGKTFSATTGTVFYRLRTAAEFVTQIITLLAHGCPPQAIVAAFGLDERTVYAWYQRAGKHCQKLHEHLVHQPRDLGQVQADEIRVKHQGGITWLAQAIEVSTRLWLGGVVSSCRDGQLISRLIEFDRTRAPVCAVSSVAVLCGWVFGLCIVHPEGVPNPSGDGETGTSLPASVGGHLYRPGGQASSSQARGRGRTSVGAGNPLPGRDPPGADPEYLQSPCSLHRETQRDFPGLHQRPGATLSGVGKTVEHPGGSHVPGRVCLQLL